MADKETPEGTTESSQDKNQLRMTPNEDSVEVRAVARYVRQSPRKVRLVADKIRGQSVSEARITLQFTPKRAAHFVSKVLESAVANAENNENLDPERLVVHRIFVDEGPALKRWIPRARGRASAIRKRTSHITVVVKEREERD